MPTLTRFVRTIALVVGLVYGTMLALAMLVDPRPRPMAEPIDSSILRNAQPVQRPAPEPAAEPLEDGDA